jgi:CRP/FNR family transcriptional regulator
MKNGNESGCTFCGKRADIFECLCKSELETINDNRIEVKYKAGELIFKQGTPNLHFLCLTSGMVKLYIEGFDGKNLVIGIVKPIEYILGPGIYADSKHHYSAMAIEDSTACLVEAGLFRSLIRSNPDFAENFIKKISLLSILNFEQAISLTQKQMPGRIADVLIYLKEKVYESNPFHTTLSRQDLADMSGMSKESAIRILKDFKDEGIIHVEGNTFKILDETHLYKISQTG